MATFKAVVNPDDKKKDGTINVKIRITHNRKSRYKATPFYLTADEITRSGKIKNQRVLDLVNDEIRKMRDKQTQLGFVVDNLDVDSVVRLLDKKDGNDDFFAYAHQYLQRMMQDPNRKSTARVHCVFIKIFRNYIGKDTLPFDMMRKRLISDFSTYLQEHYAPSTEKLIISVLQSIYNKAKKDLNDKEIGVEVVKYDCFEGYKCRCSNTKPRAFKSVEEMQKIIDCSYRGSFLFDASKDMFILSFILLGLNAIDIVRLKKDDVQDGILTYKRHKIVGRVGDKAEIKIRLSEVAKIIIEKYADNTDYLIGTGRHKRYKEFCSTKIHEVFKTAGIDDNYVFYSARHSMATFARNICGVDFMTVNDMLNHSVPRSLSVTDIYIAPDYTHIWEANDKLLALFNWDFYLKQKGTNYWKDR